MQTIATPMYIEMLSNISHFYLLMPILDILTRYLSEWLLLFLNYIQFEWKTAKRLSQETNATVVWNKVALKSLNFIYFTTITKQVIQLILIKLVGTDVCVRMVFVCEETGVPWGNPPVWLGDHMTISHADARHRTRLAAARGACVNTAPDRQY